MKKVHILLILTAALMLSTSQSVLAGVSDAAVLYLRVAAGARPGGMGEAFVSVADDATATYWNPAGLGNAPIAGILKTEKFPSRFGEISDVITLKRKSGQENWFIAGNSLIMYDGISWKTGKEYVTSSDQTLTDFVNSIVSIKSDEQAELMSHKIVEVNCWVTEAEVSSFIESVRSKIPDDYKELDVLNKGLDTLAAGYKLCLLKPDRFKDLRNKLNDGLKDETLSSDELDRVTFSIEQAVSRFLPSRLTVPFSSAIDGKLTCLGKTAGYLWVGTDKGLFRLSGMQWANFTTDEGLPSNEITVLSDAGDHILIGTTNGLAKYYHGSFVTYETLPQSAVQAVTMATPINAYAVIDGIIYCFNGSEWSDSYDYTVRIDDSIEDIARRSAIYGTPSEVESIIGRIRELNAGSAQIATDEVSADVEQTEDASLEAEPGTEETDTTANENAEILAEQSDETIVEGASDLWFSEGNVIQIPYSVGLRFDVTEMAVGGAVPKDLWENTGGAPSNILWIGTKSGLLSFYGDKWVRFGYAEFSIPVGDADGEVASMTVSDIAAKFIPDGNPDKIAVLASNISDYNDLDGEEVEPGRTVYVYNSNIGSSIRSIGFVNSKIYVGTEYGLETRGSSGWEPVDFEGLDRKQVIDCYDYEGQSYYVSTEGITSESEGQREIVFMHVNWLPSFNLDIYYDFLSYVHHKRGLGTFGISVIYLNYGSIPGRDESGNETGTLTPFEIAISASYGTSINSRLKWGMTGRFIHSRLSPQGAGLEMGSGIASTFSVDMGILYKVTRKLQFGAAITNVGPDITYIDADQSDALPRNIGIGLSYKVWDSPYNSLMVQGEINKILVGVDRDFKTELEYAIRHIGFEYWYAKFIALRAGYKYDKEGQVKHLTFGAGLKLNLLRLDFAYVPSSIDSPLANTLRISATVTF
ncbi:MAG: PorV/PorQ family protein [candidate division Zixibacteria bacterium]